MSNSQSRRRNNRHTKSGNRGPNRHVQDHAPWDDDTNDQNTASCVESGGYNPRRALQGLERSTKDLHRQTVSLERLHMLLDNEMERSLKSIRTVFDQMRTHLNTREKEMLTELDLVKEQACEIFKMRQEKAAHLKVQIDGAEKLSESERGDLRANVKHFVADRMTDEELGRTTRFQYDSDHLKKEILSFGEVIPVKCTYSAPSSSLASSGADGSDVHPSQSASHGSERDDDSGRTASEEHVKGNHEHQEPDENTDKPSISSAPSDEPHSDSWAAATPSSTDADTSPSHQHGPRNSGWNGGDRGQGCEGHGGRGGQGSGWYRGRPNQNQFWGRSHRSYSGKRGWRQRWTGDRYRQEGHTSVVNDDAS